MKNMRMAWTAAVAAGVVVLGGCGGSGTVGTARSGGGTGPVGGAGPGGAGTTDRSGGTADAAEASGASTAAGSPSGGSPAGSASGGASPSSAAAGSGDPCGLVSAADVARLAKIPKGAGGAPSTKPSQDSGGNRYCLVNDGEADSAQVGIGPITKEEFDLQKMDPDSKAVGGLGEEALYSPSDGMLKVLKNGKLLSVWVIHGGFGGDDPATLTEEKAIAQIAVGRM
ncbi:hypothetical protein GCM10009839_15790 [Catenulispora yoronensis]|uniref:DUF3558 domain-containing protein n=1 Tax=Catenulispora yoronensis TaxID=450799 RepID=A0ABN2TTF8_9ACTN